MFIAVDGNGHVVGTNETMSGLLKSLRTTLAFDILEALGCVTSDCLKDLETEKDFYTRAHGGYYQKSHHVTFLDLDYVDMVEVGMVVQTKEGRKYEVTSVDRDRKFLYVIDGVEVGGRRLASWTVDGFYYTDKHEDIRDIVAVVYD